MKVRSSPLRLLRFWLISLHVEALIPFPRSKLHLLCELLAHRLKFVFLRLARLGITHFETLKCIEDNPRNDESGVLFVIGRHDMPGRRACAGGA
jgi:hypothetical protein